MITITFRQVVLPPDGPSVAAILPEDIPVVQVGPFESVFLLVHFVDRPLWRPRYSLLNYSIDTVAVGVVSVRDGHHGTDWVTRTAYRQLETIKLTQLSH